MQLTNNVQNVQIFDSTETPSFLYRWTHCCCCFYDAYCLRWTSSLKKSILLSRTATQINHQKFKLGEIVDKLLKIFVKSSYENISEKSDLDQQQQQQNTLQSIKQTNKQKVMFCGFT